MNLRPPRPERGDLSSESRDFVDVHLDCMRSFHFVHVPATATSADPGGPGPRRLNRIDRARVRASDPHNRVDGLKIGRIPLTRHAAWSAKFSPQQITQNSRPRRTRVRSSSNRTGRIGIVQARAKIGLQPHEDGVRSNVRQRASRQAQSAHMPSRALRAHRRQSWA